MAERERHAVQDADREAALASAEARGLVLSAEQADALAHVTNGRDLGIVLMPGREKSAMLGVVREAREAAGYAVRGAVGRRRRESGKRIGHRVAHHRQHGAWLGTRPQ